MSGLALSAEIENFRDIAGFERYQISDRGRVHSGIRAGRFLAPWLTAGYHWVNLMAEGKAKPTAVLVHRLVATAFHENPLGYPIINHKNGIKTDNRPDNLEWCSYSANHIHALDNALNPAFGETHHAAILTDKKVREIRRLARTRLLHREIGQMFGVRRQTIDKIVNGQAWRRTA